MTTPTSAAAPAEVPTTEARSLLREHGFSVGEEAALRALRQRYERGDLNEISIEHKRLEFARWLVQHGRLTDYPAGTRGAGQ